MAEKTNPAPVDTAAIIAEAKKEAGNVASSVAADAAANTPANFLAVGDDRVTPQEFADKISQTLEAAILAKIAATSGPIPAFAAKMLIGQIVAPIVETLVSIVTHIGMAVPNALGDLVEKLEDKTGFDLNGDGVVGDPDEKAA